MAAIPFMFLTVTLLGQKPPTPPIARPNKTQLSQESTKKLDRLSKTLTPAARLKVHKAGLKVLRKAMASGVEVRALANQAAASDFNVRHIDGKAVDALVALILAESVKGADSDLSALMDQVKQNKQQKEALRKVQEDLLRAQDGLANTPMPMRMIAPPVRNLPNSGARYIPAPHLAAPQDLQNLNQEEAVDLYLKLRDAIYQADGGSEMGSLTVQQIQDKRATFIETISNLLKKVQESQAHVLQNLK